MPKKVRESLPLLYKTPKKWAGQALTDLMSLLSDHAYLERKAASNALELLNRWPAPDHPKDWASTLTGIARDEAAHLNSVVRLIKRKGGQLERFHKSDYASALRALVRMGQGRKELLDRLLVCALIEARSCERFDLLAKGCKDKELSKFYRTLWSSEAGHYEVFIRLSHMILPKKEVQIRWKDMQRAEAKIIQSQAPGSRIHSGVA